MKKIILILSIVFFVATHSKTEVVSKITINGNSRISNETIILFGEIKKNKNYTLKELNEVVKKLYLTEFFKVVELTIENGELIVFIEENPIVQNLVLEGIKAKKFKERILEILSIKERTSFIKSKLKNDISIIKRSFEDVGYYFVKIDTKIIENDNNTVDLIYEIDLGEKTKISKIKFLGKKIYKDRKLLSVITSEENKFWKLISSNKYLIYKMKMGLLIKIQQNCLIK